MAFETEYAALLVLLRNADPNFTPTEVQTAAMMAELDKAQKAIMRYTNWAEMRDGYANVTATLAMSYLIADRGTALNYSGSLQVAQQTQGSRSVTYRYDALNIDKDGLTSEVKAALPYPVLRVF